VAVSGPRDAAPALAARHAGTPRTRQADAPAAAAAPAAPCVAQASPPASRVRGPLRLAWQPAWCLPSGRPCHGPARRGSAGRGVSCRGVSCRGIRCRGIGQALLAACVLLVAAAAPAALAATLHLGNAGEPETLDPHRYNLRLEETILNDLFEGLVTFGPDGAPAPGAAERWETSADGLTWTFHLRASLKWSDGTPLTSADFAYSLARTVDPKTAASLAYFLYPIAGAEAVNRGEQPPSSLGVSAPDPRTLVVRLANPNPYFAERLMYPTAYPVPRHVIERAGDDWIKPDNFVGNGAYVLAEWLPQGHVRLRRNEHFHAVAGVRSEEVYYYPLDDELGAFNRFRAGEVHAIGGFPSSQLESVRREHADALRLSPLLSIMYLVFNVTAPPFDDVRVREALSLVVERETLTQRVLRTGDVPSASFVPALVHGYEPVPLPGAALPRAERLERARGLLAAAGYGPERPLAVELRHIAGIDSRRAHVALAAMWQEIGVRATLLQAELKVHFAELRQGNFQVAQAGWFGENNPEHYLSLLESTTGSVNYGRYANPRYDALLARARATVAMPARVALYREAEALIGTGVPVVPLYSVMVRALVDPRLEGWQDNARAVHAARYLWLRDAAPGAAPAR
jgi:oligopeptide transport system substrate-binding protein